MSIKGYDVPRLSRVDNAIFFVAFERAALNEWFANVWVINKHFFLLTISILN